MEDFRMQYPLDAGALVLDAGAYRGDFIEWCRRKWNCRVIAFEPSGRFFADVSRRFESDGLVRIYNYGLAGEDATMSLAVQGDSTSVYLDMNQAAVIESARLRDVCHVFDELGLSKVDLFKINIEGGEYGLMARMLDAEMAERVRYFQIQYHGIGAGPEGPAAARDKIRERLATTHKEEWCLNDGQWESWGLR